MEKLSYVPSNLWTIYHFTKPSEEFVLLSYKLACNFPPGSTYVCLDKDITLQSHSMPPPFLHIITKNIN